MVYRPFPIHEANTYLRTLALPSAWNPFPPHSCMASPSPPTEIYSSRSTQGIFLMRCVSVRVMAEHRWHTQMRKIESLTIMWAESRETRRNMYMPHLVSQSLTWALGGQRVETVVEPRTEEVGKGLLREAATF